MHTRRVVLTVAAAAACGLLGLRADEAVRTIRPQFGSQLSPRGASELIVQFRSPADEATEERAVRRAGGVRARRSAFGNRYAVTLEPGSTLAQGLARFRNMPEVEYAEANHVARALFRPNDNLFRAQWNFQLIEAERMWDIQRGDTSVVVAVADTGIAYEDYGPFRKAPDWGSTQFATGYNAFTGDSHANDDNFHGTHVASTIGEGTDNQLGVAGLVVRTRLMPVKVLDSEGFGTYFGIAEGIDYVTGYREGGSNPVKVLNLSLGGDSESTTLQRAVERAVDAGILVVAAAGNDGEGRLSFPGSLGGPNGNKGVISVGAVDGRKQLTPYSNFGPDLDVVAPGGDLDRDDDGDGIPDGVLQQTLDPDTALATGRYDDFALFLVVGTSQATPHVAALAALLVKHGITDPRAVKAAIVSTAEDLGASGRDDTYGNGLIRPDRALSGLGIN